MSGEEPKFLLIKDKLNNKFQANFPLRLIRKFQDAINQKRVAINELRIPRGVDADPSQDDGAALLLYYYLITELYDNSKEIAVVEKPDFEDWKPKKLRVLQLKQPIAQGAILLDAVIGRNAFYRAWTVLDVPEFEDLSTDKPLVNLTHKKVRTGDEDYEGEFVCRFEAADLEKGKKVKLVGTVKSRSDTDETVFSCECKIPPPPEEEDDLPEFVKVSEATFSKGCNGSTKPSVDVTTLKLPEVETKRTKELKDSTGGEPKHKKEDPKGKCRCRITPDKVHVNQSMGTPCKQFVTLIMHVENLSAEKRAAIHKKPKVSYLAADGETWVDASGEAMIGVASQGLGNYGGLDFQTMDENLVLDHKSDANMIVQFNVEVEGKCSSDRQTIHRTLPQPFTVKATVTENEDAPDDKGEDACFEPVEHTVEMQQVNPPKTYINEAKCAENWKAKDIKGFAFADDVANDERYYVGIYTDADGKMVARHHQQYHILDQDTYNSWAYTAVKKKTAKLELEDILHWDSGDNQTRAYALVDLEKQVTYGLEVAVRTADGSATASAHVF